MTRTQQLTRSFWPRLLSAGALLLAMSGVALFGVVSCGEQGGGGGDADGGDGASAGGQGKEGATYVIGVVAKAQANPVFQAARVGAYDAAEELSEQYGIDVQIEWLTPNTEDAQKQAEYVEQLASSGVNGIAISASDSSLLAGVLSDAIESGIEVVTFDSDVPGCDRLAYYGVNDKAAGATVMRELARVMGGEGVVGVLAGNLNSENMARRVEGVREEAGNHAGIELRDVYSEPSETAADMAAKLQQIHSANPDIEGWAFVGGWPLYTDNALDGIHETADIVSMDALPLPIEYLVEGQVQALVGQPYHSWGAEPVRVLIEKLHNGVEPEDVLMYEEFDIVTTENAERFVEQWNEWLGD